MSGLPIGTQLRRAGLVVLLLGLWAPFKIAWEQGIARQQNVLRHHGVAMDLRLRDRLGQGMALGVLSGLQNTVATLIWVYSVNQWETKQWFSVEQSVNLCTSLEPRSITFWSLGGWQLAWNASVYEFRNPKEPNDLRRLKASQFWIAQGLDVYKRGIENNPEHYKLWADTALLYQNRLAEQEARRGQNTAAARDFKNAAYYYAEAMKRPDAPIFLERFPAIMLETAGDNAAAYAEWRALWYRLTPAEKKQPQHAASEVETKIRALEKKLSIPPEKRVFPN